MPIRSVSVHPFETVYFEELGLWRRQGLLGWIGWIELWWVHCLWRHIRLAMKPCYPGSHASQIKIYNGTLQRSHGPSFRIRHEKRLKRPLAEKSGWRHIRLSLKPRYLGNYASQIKSYSGTLIGSHGRPFRIRYDNLPDALPSGETTMTSYPPCNKTSLSRKPCIPDKWLRWNTIRKSWALFQNLSWTIDWSAP